MAVSIVLFIFSKSLSCWVGLWENMDASRVLCVVGYVNRVPIFFKAHKSYLHMEAL